MRTLIATTILLAALWAAPALAEEQRDPFLNSYQFAEAIHHITVQGIVISGKVERIIVMIDGYTEPAVFRTGDTIAVFHQGLAHEFTIREVSPRRVRFEAGPKPASKDKGAFTYEVQLL